jgi:hypothetical protein
MAENRALRLETLGYSVEEIPGLKTIPHGTYKTKDGKEIHGLPTDDYHRRRYLARGFTLISQEK